MLEEQMQGQERMHIMHKDRGDPHTLQGHQFPSAPSDRVGWKLETRNINYPGGFSTFKIAHSLELQFIK